MTVENSPILIARRNSPLVLQTGATTKLTFEQVDLNSVNYDANLGIAHPKVEDFLLVSASADIEFRGVREAAKARLVLYADNCQYCQIAGITNFVEPAPPDEKPYLKMSLFGTQPLYRKSSALDIRLWVEYPGDICLTNAIFGLEEVKPKINPVPSLF